MAGRPCEACRHPRNRDIDRALVNEGRAEQLARKYGLSLSSLQRHRKNHLQARFEASSPVPIAASEAANYEEWLERAKLDNAADVLGFAKFLLWRLDRLVHKAEQDGDTRAAIAAVNGMMKTVTDLFAKAYSVISDAPQIDQSTRIFNVLAGISDDELRAFIATPSKTIVSQEHQNA